MPTQARLFTKHETAARLNKVINEHRLAASLDVARNRRDCRAAALAKKRGVDVVIERQQPFLAGGRARIPSLENMKSLPPRQATKMTAVSVPLLEETKAEKEADGRSRFRFIPRKIRDLSRFRSVETKVAALLSSPMIDDRHRKATPRVLKQHDLDVTTSSLLQHCSFSATTGPSLGATTGPSLGAKSVLSKTNGIASSQNFGLRRSLRIASRLHFE